MAPIVRTEELLFTPNVIEKLRKDEIHILYQEKRITDIQYRELTITPTKKKGLPREPFQRF